MQRQSLNSSYKYLSVMIKSEAVLDFVKPLDINFTKRKKASKADKNRAFLDSFWVQFFSFTHSLFKSLV